MSWSDVMVVLSDVTIYPPMVLPEQPTVAWQAFSGTIDEVRFVKGDPSEYPALRVGEPMTAMTWAYRSEEEPLPQSDVEGFEYLLAGTRSSRLRRASSSTRPCSARSPYPRPVERMGSRCPGRRRPGVRGAVGRGRVAAGLLRTCLTRVRHAARHLGLDTRTDLETLTAWVAELTAFEAAVQAAYAEGGAEAAEALQEDMSAAGPLTAAYVTIIAEGPWATPAARAVPGC